MVLESLMRPSTATRHPFEMFFYGILVSSVAMGYWVFPEELDLMLVFFTVMACIPIMFHVIRNEEKKDEIIDDERTLLREHGRVISFFLFLFLGITLTFVAWYIFLPGATSERPLRAWE